MADPNDPYTLAEDEVELSVDDKLLTAFARNMKSILTVRKYGPGSFTPNPMSIKLTTEQVTTMNDLMEKHYPWFSYKSDLARQALDIGMSIMRLMVGEPTPDYVLESKIDNMEQAQERIAAMTVRLRQVGSTLSDLIATHGPLGAYAGVDMPHARELVSVLNEAVHTGRVSDRYAQIGKASAFTLRLHDGYIEWAMLNHPHSVWMEALSIIYGE